MGTIWFTVWCALLLNVQASPAGRTEDQICEPGFDSESVIFKVTEKHLRPTTILGKVNFTDCTDVKRLIFSTYDSHFYVETDGTVKVSRWLVLQEGQRRFFIHSWDSKGKKRTVSAVVQYQRDHDAAHGLQSDFPLEDITKNLEVAQGGGRSRRDADPKIDHSSSEKLLIDLLIVPVPFLYFPPSMEALRRDKRWIIPPISIVENSRGPFPLFIAQPEEGMRRKRSWVIPALSVPENSRGPFPLKLAQVRSDRSEVTKIIYRLHGPGADQPPVGLFIIDSDSGWLEVTQELDRENQHKYTLEALAVEEGQAEASETIEIIVNVIDQNDNKPVFSRDTFEGEVPQSSAKGFEVMTVQATDSDEENTDNSDICYRIVRQEPEEPSPSMFAINTSTGLITVEATGLDREKHPQYTLTVTAADMRGEGLIGRANVILTITDSSSPAGWVIPDIPVPENGIGPFPLQLAQIRFKEDEKKKILYNISGPGADQPPVGLFTMDGDTGHLYVTQGLDRENQDKYTLQVNAVAEDGGTTVGQTQAVVKVTDQNDNKPVFNKDTYEGEVPEASPIGFQVIKVEATDADEPNTDNSEIRYSIISQEPAEPSMFNINPVSGAIILSTDGLNREKQPQYTLLVKAEDSAGKGSTTLFEQVKVILTVTANSVSMSQAGEAKRRRKRSSTAPLSVMGN